MLRLRTFAGLTLARGGQDLTGAVTQRRRLGILTLLAVAGTAGLSRDKLQAYLWPESESGRARHVLNQLLYAQRRQVDAEGLFLGRKTLRLNPAIIWTDVGAFQEAVQRGSHEEAVRLYAGPFLDGFFLKDAPEFEQWVETQRARLSQQFLLSLSALATAAGNAGDLAAAATWWHRAAEADPLDSRVVLHLVEALVAAGDRPGALRQALRHEELLRTELGVPADPRLREVMVELRRQ